MPSISPGDITVVTTCMGRLEFVKQTMVNRIQNSTFPIVVVDYSCPHGTSAWVESLRLHERVTVVKAHAETHLGRPVFNVARARNIGAGHVKTGYVLFLDAETLISPHLQEWFLENTTPRGMGVPVPVHGELNEIWGTLMIHRDVLNKVGGYDEKFRGWGSEDVDLRFRLVLEGIECVKIPLHYLKTIPHSDALRSHNNIEQDFKKARKMNHNYFVRKTLRQTGKSLALWWKDPVIMNAMHHQATSSGH
jgi:predicted glycosyltransferase involved in capsule biosynthesis